MPFRAKLLGHETVWRTLMSASSVVLVLEGLSSSLLTWHIWDQHYTGYSSLVTLELQAERTARVRVKVGGKERSTETLNCLGKFGKKGGTV